MSKKKDNIDYSDIPETDEEFWEDAEVHMPRNKKSLTIRLDAEIVEWFKQNGSGYQTKMNAILKSYMLKHKDIDHNKKSITL